VLRAQGLVQCSGVRRHPSVHAADRAQVVV
jgi:hypothetical protein